MQMISFLKYFKSLKTIEKIFFIFFISYLIGLFLYIFPQRIYYLWDFQGYYAAAKCYMHHLNPYNIKELYLLHTNIVPLPYMYPPLATYYYIPFAFLNIESAAAIFLFIKLAALIGLYYIWSRIYFDKQYFIAFLYFSLLAFSASMCIDLFSGNISIFEQLIIWTAIYFFLQEKLWKFSLLIIVVSTIKLLPVVFLVFILFSQSKNKMKIFLSSVVIFVSYLALNYIMEPILTTDYVNAFFSFTGKEGGITNPVKEGGITAACSLEFFRSFITLIYPSAPSYLFVSIYLAFVSVVSFLTWAKLKGIIKNNERNAKLILVFTLCLGIIIILPRFKNYSYILAVLPVFYLIIKSYKKTGVTLLLILFCLSTPNFFSPIFQLFWEYSPLIISFIAWLCYLKEIDALKENVIPS
jgi:hypothetical protein